MADGRVIIEIDADEDPYLTAVAGLEAQTTKTMDTVARGMKNAGTALTASLTVPIVAFGAYSVKSAIDFESSFAGVRKTVKATEEEFAELANVSKAMSEVKPISANDINLIMELGGQLGIATDQLETFAGTIADLSVSTDLDIEEGSKQMAQYANITGMAQSEFDRFGSTIVALGNTTATTESAIMAMAHRIAGAGSQIGLTDDQILGLSASLSSVGIEAEMGGTAISTVMSQIDRDVAMNTAAVETWAQSAGMSAKEFADTWKKDPIAALQSLFSGLNSATGAGENMNVMLDTLGVSSLRQTDMMKRLSNASGVLSGAVDTASNAWAENNAMQNEAAQRYMTTESQLAIFHNKIQNVAATVGGPLIAAINAMIDGLDPLMTSVANGAKAFAEMDPMMRNTIMAFTGMTAAAGPVLLLMSKLMSASSNVSTRLKDLITQTKGHTTTLKAETTATAAAVVAKEADAAASKASAASVKVSTTGKQAAAAASTAEAAATGVATVSKGIYTAATGAATVATNLFAVALRMIPGMLIVTAITAAVSALVGWATSSEEAADSTEDLTAASREQKAKVDELQRSYDEVVEKQGEHSTAALEAKAALDKEQDSFENSKQTIAEFGESIDEAIQSNEELMASVDDSLVKSTAQADAITDLADRYAELTSKEELDADGKADLAAVTEQLIGSSDELATLLSSEGSAAEVTAEQVAALAKAEADRVRGAAATDALISLKDEEIDLNTRLIKAQSELQTENERTADSYKVLTDWYNQYADEAANLAPSEAAKQLQGNIDDLTVEIEKNQESQVFAAKIAAEWTDKEQKLKKALEHTGGSYSKAQEAAELFGLTEQEVTEYIDQQAALVEAEATVAVNEYADALRELCDTNSDLSQALSDSGYSIDDLAQKLYDKGVSVEEFSSGVSNLASTAQDAFGKVKYAAEISLDQMIENLQYNVDATNTWSSNVAALYEKAGSDSERSFVDHIVSLGIEYAPVVQQILDDTDGKLSILADLYSQGGKAAVAGFLVEAGIAPEKAAEIANEVAESTVEGLESGEEGAAAAGEKKGTAYVDSATTAVNEGLATLSESVDTQLNDVAQKGTDTGYKITENVAVGISESTGLVTDAMTGLSSAITMSLESVNASSQGMSLGTTLATGITLTLPNVSAAVNNHITMIIGMLDAVDLAPQGGHMTTTLATGITAQQGQVNLAISNICSAAIAIMILMPIYATSIGAQTSAGLASGIYANGAAVSGAMASVVSAAIARGRAEAEIRSPSRKTRRDGRMLDAGWAGGILDDAELVARAAEDTMAGAIEAGQSAVTNTWVDLPAFRGETFRPPAVSATLQSARTVSGGTITYNNYNVNGVELTEGTPAAEAMQDFISHLAAIGAM